METKGDTDAPVLNVEFLSLSSVEPHLRGLIRTRWSEKKLSEVKSRRIQMMELLDEIPATGPHNPWWISMNMIALVFGIEKSAFQRIIDCEKESRMERKFSSLIIQGN